MIEKEEQIIVGAVVQVFKPVTVHPKYKTIFHGQTKLTPGNYVWWHPIKYTPYAVLINQLSIRYKGIIKVNYGLAGTAEV